MSTPETPVLPTPPDMVFSKTMTGTRIFASPEIQAQIDAALNALPPEHRAATLDVGFDKDGIVAVAAARLDGGWSMYGALEERFHEGWAGRFGVRWSGK